MDLVEFRVIEEADDEYGPKTEITPFINRVSLVELVSAFETSAAYFPAGSYGGIIPEYFNYGDLRSYYLGDHLPQSYFFGRHNYLLGCDCGEVSCWPLLGRISKQGATYVWNNFSNEQRDWSYDGFGPFRFDKAQYEQALEVF